MDLLGSWGIVDMMVLKIQRHVDPSLQEASRNILRLGLNQDLLVPVIADIWSLIV